MNFDLGPDELALRDAVRDVCRAKFSDPRAGFSREAWAALDEAGVFGLRVPEEDGGVGLGMTEAVIVFEELGRWLVPTPVIDTHLSRTRGATEDVILVAERDDPVIEHLDDADVVGVIDEEGVWRVMPGDVDAEPVARPLDPLTPAHFVRALPRGQVVARHPGLAAGFRLEGALLTAAYLAGIAGRVVELAVEYAKEREQFGRPIGSFQAVKHICADMLTRAEVARAAVHAAGVALDGNGDGDPARAVAAAKLLASEAAVANGKACVQVYGGMGFTWEVDVHLYLKRAAVLAQRWGSADEHAEAMAACL